MPHFKISGVVVVADVARFAESASVGYVVVDTPERSITVPSNPVLFPGMTESGISDPSPATTCITALVPAGSETVELALTQLAR
jgi:hypothetical protein